MNPLYAARLDARHAWLSQVARAREAGQDALIVPHLPFVVRATASMLRIEAGKLRDELDKADAQK